jgi:hypothetical protein
VGVGSGTASPTRSTADARGVATTSWTLGTTAGTARLTAQVNGVTPVVFTATVIAGPAALLVASPEAAYLNVGDTVRVRGSLRDQYGNTIVGQSITYSTLDPTLATVNSSGLVTAVAVGTARVVAEASSRADTVPVTISATGSSVCGPLTARVLSLGEVFIPPAGSSSITTCLTSPSAINAELNRCSLLLVGPHVLLPLLYPRWPSSPASCRTSNLSSAGPARNAPRYSKQPKVRRISSCPEKFPTAAHSMQRSMLLSFLRCTRPCP